MKIREGFVTNSSSTNFIIMSKEELTEELLFQQLGFLKGTPMEEYGRELCHSILRGILKAPKWFEFEQITFDLVLKLFGKETAARYKILTDKRHKAYIGCTGSDEDTLISIFTCDSFEINESDFFVDGSNCVW